MPFSGKIFPDEYIVLWAQKPRSNMRNNVVFLDVFFNYFNVVIFLTRVSYPVDEMGDEPCRFMVAKAT
jgi:hypothetical protein